MKNNRSIQPLPLLLQVDTNGLIYVSGGDTGISKARWPITSRQLIAPYWADVDTTETGKVWYRETTNPALLERAHREIREFFSELEDFVPLSIFISTWDCVGYYLRRADKVRSSNILIMCSFLKIDIFSDKHFPVCAGNRWSQLIICDIPLC